MQKYFVSEKIDYGKKPGIIPRSMICFESKQNRPEFVKEECDRWIATYKYSYPHSGLDNYNLYEVEIK